MLHVTGHSSMSLAPKIAELGSMAVSETQLTLPKDTIADFFWVAEKWKDNLYS